MKTFTRRQFLKATGGMAALAGLAGCSGLGLAGLAGSRAARRPNVLVVLADDMGYGDLACHGNPLVKTPWIDRLHAESVRFTDFHSAPMCSPTRGQLLTGVDCLRNGAMATCAGRAMVRQGIPTLGEAFAAGGYRTGIFGKWHLGFSYPHRPEDQGFQETLYHQGFGLTGAGDYWFNDYFDPWYHHNGRLEQGRGYCDDVWFAEAMRWMAACHDAGQPFLCYLPTNIPHFPEWVAPEYASPYEGQPGQLPPYFGMVANLDDNMRRLDAFLRASGLRDDTILVFMSDNGAVVGTKFYNAGMTGGKCALTEGGHRVPCFVRWPGGGLRAAGDVAETAQMQDILPTLLDLCGLPAPKDARFDGASLAPLLRDPAGAIADRMMVVQYYQSSVKKGDAAVMWGRWRLIRMNQLFDIHADLAQKNDLAADHPDVVEKMRAHYENWWAGVEAGIFDYVPSHIGSDAENPVMLCSCEWQDVRCDGKETVRKATGGTQGGIWNVQVERAGSYEIELRRWPREADAALADGVPEFQGRVGRLPEGQALPIASAALRVGALVPSGPPPGTVPPPAAGTAAQPAAATAAPPQPAEGKTAGGAAKTLTLPAPAGAKAVTFKVDLPAGRTQIHAWFRDVNGQDLCGAFFAYVTRM